jgi:hypothetical protein
MLLSNLLVLCKRVTHGQLESYTEVNHVGVIKEITGESNKESHIRLDSIQ